MPKSKELSYRDILGDVKKAKLNKILKNPTACKLILCLIKWFKEREMVQSYQMARLMGFSRAYIHDILKDFVYLNIIKEDYISDHMVVFMPVKNAGVMVLEHYVKECRDRLKLGV